MAWTLKKAYEKSWCAFDYSVGDSKLSISLIILSEILYSTYNSHELKGEEEDTCEELIIRAVQQSTQLPKFSLFDCSVHVWV